MPLSSYWTVTVISQIIIITLIIITIIILSLRDLTDPDHNRIYSRQRPTGDSTYF